MGLILPTKESLTADVRAKVSSLPNMEAKKLCTSITQPETKITIPMTRRDGFYIPEFRNPSLPAGVNIITGKEAITFEAAHIREKNALDHNYVDWLEEFYLPIDKSKARLAADQITLIACNLAADQERRWELLRMSLLLTGAISVSTPTAHFAVDFQLASDHKKILAGTKKWNDANFDGDILADFDAAKYAINSHSQATIAAAKMNSNSYAKMYAALVKQYGGEDKLPSGWRDQHADSHLKQIRGVAIEIDDRSGLNWTNKKGAATTMLADGTVVFHSGAGTMAEYSTRVRDMEATSEVGYFAKINVVPDPSAVEIIVQSNGIPAMPEPDRVYVLTAY